MGREEWEKCEAPTVLVERLRHGDGLPLPSYGTSGAAGADLCAAVDGPVTVPMGEVVLIPTGLKFAIPAGFELQLRPRSGLALKSGLTLVNAPGTIDSDYRGEVKVIVTCVVNTPCVIHRGDRIAQAVLAPVSRASWRESDSLPETTRGSGGFGHTGVQMEGPGE